MKLEDFVKKYRDEFDDKEPPLHVWSEVDKNLPRIKSDSIWNSVGIWRAAAVFFMVTSVFLWLPREKFSSQNSSETLQEFKDVEKFYNQQISNKVRLITQYDEAEGLNGYTQDFHQLEAMYMVLKEEMRIRPSEKVRDALVLNLLVRIDLLNQQLQKLEKENDRLGQDKES